MLNCSSPYYVGDICSISCSQAGAVLIGNETIECLVTGYWEAASAACIIPVPNYPPSGLTLSTSSVLETVPVGTAIGTFIVSDRNLDQTHAFILVDSDEEFFRISGNNLIVIRLLNYETSKIHEIRVFVRDDGNPPLNATFSLNITVLDENKPPSSATISNNVITENVPLHTVVGSLSATDLDDGQTVSFMLMTTSGGKFALRNNSQLVTTSNLNYERQSQFMLAIKVTDSAFPPLSTITTINITVLDSNDPPTAITPSFVLSKENPSIGELVTTLAVDDEDDNDTYTLTLTPSFGLVVSDLQLIVNDPSFLDYEAYPSHRITISMHLVDGEFNLTQMITIQLTDTNEASTGITLSSYSVHEHSPMGSVIGELTATDPDITNSHTFTLLSNSNLVRISGTSLLVNSDIDYEVFPSFSIVVTVSDKGELNYTQTINISVINQNEAPQNFSFTPNPLYTCSVSKPDTACVPENDASFQSIGQLYATDPDGDNVTFMLTNFTVPSSYFKINHTNSKSQLLQSGYGLNYESKLYGHQILLFVDVSDQLGHSTLHTITVRILNANDPPITVTLSNTVISEQALVGQIIGSLDAIDEDEGDQLIYRLDHNPDGLFGIDGDHLVVAKSLNHESTTNAHNISIICSDGIAETIPIWFVIEISDANEPPISISLNNTAVLENSPLYTTIGAVTAYDMDVNDTLAFHLDDNARGKFRLVQNENEHILQSLKTFDYETEDSYNIVVRVTDSYNNSKLQLFTIQVSSMPCSANTLTCVLFRLLTLMSLQTTLHSPTIQFVKA